MGWLIPVGTPGGINSGLAGLPDGSGIVRLGTELIGLEADMYRLWRAAAAAPQAGELMSWAAGQGIEDAGERIRVLADMGLVIEDGPDAHQAVGSRALRLLGECLGNGADQGPAFVVLGRQNMQLQVDAYVYEILLHTDGVRPVAMTCAALDALRPGVPAGIETLTSGLPLLVRNEVVALEAAR
jgi:hypothetical protein